MTREEKGQLIDKLAEKISNTPYFYIADASGLNVAQINEFREMCYKEGIDYQVVKNTLIKKALERQNEDYSGLDEALKGYSGIMFSPEAGKTPAKIIRQYRKKDKNRTKPAIKAASIEADIYLGDENLETLSNLKSKSELIGDVIGLLQSPAKNVVSALQSGGHTIAGLVKTLSEREES